jgi:predicted N-acyltransferase
MQEIYNCMQELAAKEKASMLIFKDFASAYNDVLEPFLKKGFSRVESLPSTEMDINFGSFEDYLKTLSRSSRDGLKRNFKKVDNKAKINFEVKDILDDGELAQIHELYLQTYEKLDIGLEKLPVNFFKNVCRNMPGNIKFFLWRIEGKLAAFAFCLFSGDYFIDYYLGFDYSLAHDYYLYFIRFRDLLKWCITHGIKKYEMGQTVYEAKRRLGFSFIRLYFYMKHRNPFLNPLFCIVSPLFKPENFDPVFKEMKNKNPLSRPAP